MQVKLNKNFPLDGSVETAWSMLQDIEVVAGCMPGAEITEIIDAEHFKGRVRVKIGPMNMAFNGDIAVQDIDADEKQIHLIASGQDSKGSSSAKMDLTARIQVVETGACELKGDAEVTVNGKLANFGGRMMTQVSDQILAQFADNFAKRLAVDTKPEQATAPTPESATNEINGLKFAWQALIGFVRGIFARKTF